MRSVKHSIKTRVSESAFDELHNRPDVMGPWNMSDFRFDMIHMLEFMNIEIHGEIWMGWMV